MVAWTRSRVSNFGPEFARRYVGLLVNLDGKPYDQEAFFHALVEAGLRKDVPAEEGRKRWDAYSNKIREFGLGFAVDEFRLGIVEGTRRKGGPTKAIWRASPIAKDFVAGRLDFRQFMAVQCTRAQLPRPGMPLLNKETRQEIERGIRIRPLTLLLDALDTLAVHGAAPYLSREDIHRHLTTVEQHEQLGTAVAAIIASREGSPSGQLTDQPYLDIWLNEFAHTGYIRQLRPAKASELPPHIVVRAMPRREEARRLHQATPLQQYDSTPETMDAYFDFLWSSPSAAERQAMLLEPLVVPISVSSGGAYNATESTLTGSVETIGGLMEGNRLFLLGDELSPSIKSVIFTVTTPATERPEGSRVTVRVQPVATRVDGHPIVVGTRA